MANGRRSFAAAGVQRYTEFPHKAVAFWAEIPYRASMQSVVETNAYLSAAKAAGMTDMEQKYVVDMLSADPTAGELIVGTGGCRKVRIAGRGKGKSGGYRVVTVFGGQDVPVFLLTVFGKGEKDNLSKSEKNSLEKLTTHLFDKYRASVPELARRSKR